MHLIDISLRFYSLSDRYKNIDKIIFIKDIVIKLLILLHSESVFSVVDGFLCAFHGFWKKWVSEEIFRINKLIHRKSKIANCSECHQYERSIGFGSLFFIQHDKYVQCAFCIHNSEWKGFVSHKVRGKTTKATKNFGSRPHACPPPPPSKALLI